MLLLRLLLLRLLFYAAAASLSALKQREAEKLIVQPDGRVPLFSAVWQPEYASYMIEAVPAAAANLDPESWLQVEDSIRSRRTKLRV